MKVVYWYAQCLDDHECYSVRERTKRAALAAVEACDVYRYGPVVKVEVEYSSGLDLLKYVCGEFGIAEEAIASREAG